MKLEADQNLAGYEFYTGQLITVQWVANARLTSVTGAGASEATKITSLSNGNLPDQTMKDHWLTYIGAGKNCGNGFSGTFSCAYAYGGAAATPTVPAVTAGTYSVYLGEMTPFTFSGKNYCGPCVVSTNTLMFVMAASSPLINITVATPYSVLKSRVDGVQVYSGSTLISGVGTPAVTPVGGSNVTVVAKLVGSARVGTAVVRMSTGGGGGGGGSSWTYYVPLTGLAMGANWTTSIQIPATWPAGTGYTVSVSIIGTASGMTVPSVSSATFPVAAAPTGTPSNTVTPSQTPTPSFSSTTSASQTPTPTGTPSTPIDLNALLKKASASANSDSLVMIIGVVVGVIVIGIGAVVGMRLYQKKQMSQRKRKMVASGKEAHMLYLGPSSAPAPAARASAGTLRQADSVKAPSSRSAPEASSGGGKGKAAFAPEEVAPSSAGKKVRRDPSQRGPAW